MTVKELRAMTGMSQRAFGKYFDIPFRTVQDWEAGKSECKKYIVALLEYRLRSEGIIE